MNDESRIDYDAFVWPNSKPETAAPPDVSATPYTWRDPKTIPPRRFIYARHYLRSNVSTTIAQSGAGKSSLAVVEMLAIATGRALLDITPAEIAKVWWVTEDDREEIERMISAAAVHYGIGEKDLRDRFYADSLRDKKLIVAETMRDGTKVNAPVVAGVIETIKSNGIGLLVVDPFIGSHRVNENDNNAIQIAAEAWREVADKTGCAIELIHHSRKTNGASVGVEDGRGASALLALARSARAVNSMTETQAEEVRIDPEDARRYFRTTNGKASKAPPSSRSDWYHLVSVDLCNTTYNRPSDEVGVATSWQWPSSEEAHEQRAGDAASAETKFIELLARYQAQGRAVSPKPSITYGPAMFAVLEDSGGFTKRAFADAMERLLKVGRIEIQEWGPPSKRHAKLVIVRN